MDVSKSPRYVIDACRQGYEFSKWGSARSLCRTFGVSSTLFISLFYLFFFFFVFPMYTSKRSARLRSSFYFLFSTIQQAIGLPFPPRQPWVIARLGQITSGFGLHQVSFQTGGQKIPRILGQNMDTRPCSRCNNFSSGFYRPIFGRFFSLHPYIYCVHCLVWVEREE